METYRGVHVVQDHVQPPETCSNGGRERGGHCHTDGQQDNGRNLSQERGTHTNEEVIEQISLLARLDPLWKT